MYIFLLKKKKEEGEKKLKKLKRETLREGGR